MNKKIVVSGKRKNAVAKVGIKEGSGVILYNGLSHTELGVFQRLSLEEPAKIAENFLGKFDFDIEIKTSGGGKEGQIQAARLGIAKAIVSLTKNLDLRKAFIDYDRNILVADVRRKEARKPGDSKARAKRQKSYR